jgi:hypothetical protein
VRAARTQGVKKILITHPEAPFINMATSTQVELARQGCRFERTWVFTTPVMHRPIRPDRITNDIKQVGIESTVLATDMGQADNPSPIEGYREFVAACLHAGFLESDVWRMGSANISEWLS